MSRTGLALAAALTAAAAAVACSGGGEDARNETAAPPEAPQRIISLIPSVTETIIALGAADRLIARSAFDHDTAVANLPSIGGGLTPSLEQLTALDPDLVIAWPDSPERSVIERLADLGVKIYTPEIQSLGDIRRTTHELGVLLGLEAAADSLVANLDSRLAEVRRRVQGLPRPSVLYVVWLDPPTTAGNGTYIDQLIDIAGGRNVFDDAPGLWPQVSREEIVRRQPDIILVAQAQEAFIDIGRLRSAPGWRRLAAVRDGRVFRLDANLYNRPGPSVAEAARRLALILHPDTIAPSP